MNLPITDTGIRRGVSCGADTGVLIILGVVSVISLGFGICVWGRPPVIWTPLLIITCILTFLWAGALSVRFSFDHSEIRYRSLYTQLRLRMSDITGIAIVTERSGHAPQGVARLHLILRDGPPKKLNVKMLPLPAVKEFCSALQARGVTVDVDNSFAARRMASQIFGKQA